MQMKITTLGVGVGIPKTDIGISLMSGVYISFRRHESCIPLVYNLFTYNEIGNGNNTIAFNNCETEWFNVDPGKFPFIKDIHNCFNGKVGEMKVNGTMLGKGHIDFDFNVFTQEGDEVFSMKKKYITAKGGQISNFMVRGRFRRMIQKQGVCIT